MTHEVILPALGMVQSTGRLVRWLKAPGDAVSVGEPLFEVETDKATMEVEAQANGYLAAVEAEAGQDVPVGQVIARIVAQITDAAPPLPAPTLPAPPVAAQAAAPAIAPPQAPRPVGQPAGGRILASPKARRMAAQEGLDLALLVQAGQPQPYHAADLVRLRALSAAPVPVAAPASVPVPALATAPPSALLHVAARVPRSGSDGFLARMRDEAGITLDRRALWLALAAAAWRAARPGSDALVVEWRHPGGDPTRWLDPDRARLSAQPDAGEAAPGLILRDLTGTCLTAMWTGAEAAPVVTLADDGDSLRLAFDTGAALSDETAQAFVCDLARRLADPLPYLV
jgi:hypothetical protein